MKYSIAVQFTIIAWFSTCVLAQTYKPPAGKVIQEKLNLTMPEFIKKCQTHKGVIQELKNKDRMIATKIAYALADELVKAAKKLPQIDEKSWDELNKSYCLENVILIILNESDVDDINECFDEQNKLKGEKKTDFTNALNEAYCAAVKTLAKETYAANKN